MFLIRTISGIASQWLFVLAILLMSTAARSQTATETARPKPILPFTEFTLDNGLTVLVREDHKLPIVSIEVLYQAGSRNDPPGKAGLAHLFEHLLFYGSQHHPHNFLVAMQRLGVTNVNGGTGPDLTTVYETVPISQLDAVLWLESDRMGYLRPLLPRRRSTNRSSSSATRSIWVGTNPGEMCATTLRPASFRPTIPIKRTGRRSGAIGQHHPRRRSKFFQDLLCAEQCRRCHRRRHHSVPSGREGQTLFRRLADRPAPRSNNHVGTRAQPGQA